jgi:2-dehydropantoate 2-reductase
MKNRSAVLFFGNTAGQNIELTEALGDRVLFGFPAAGGVRDGTLIRYVLIRQMDSLAHELQAAVHRTGSATPDLDILLSRSP